MEKRKNLLDQKGPVDVMAVEFSDQNLRWLPRYGFHIRIETKKEILHFRKIPNRKMRVGDLIIWNDEFNLLFSDEN